MRRNFSYLALASAIAALSACGSGDAEHDADIGSTVGPNDLAALITLSPEPPGMHCVEASTKVNVGPDTNGNGVLDDDEITQTTYVCTGATGATGAAGAAGQDGKDGQNASNALMLLSSEMAGANCAFGGTRIDAGLDANGNDVLDPGEVTSTGYVCNAAATPIVLQSGATQGTANASYLAADPDAPIELILPAAPALGDTLAITGAGAGGWVLRQNPGQSILATGLPVIPSELSWSLMPAPQFQAEYVIGLASSSDGRHLCYASRGGGVSGYSGYFYGSNDGGINWHPNLSTSLGVIEPPGAVAASADGSCFTVNASGRVRIRRTLIPDGSPGWATASPPILASLTSATLAVSADGSRLLIADKGVSQLYRSVDGGLTWEATTSSSLLATGWAAVGMSANGLQVYALPANMAPVVVSHDGWRTRSPKGPTPAALWTAIAVSGDGRTIIAGTAGGKIYRSLDYGLTWGLAEAMPAAINSLAISHDGRAMLAGVDNGFLYQSGSHGTTWTRVHTGWVATTNVQVALSADGGSFFAAADHKLMSFTRAKSRSSTGDAGLLAGLAGDAVTLQYVGNGEFIVLRYTSNSGSFTVH